MTYEIWATGPRRGRGLTASLILLGCVSGSPLWAADKPADEIKVYGERNAQTLDDTLSSVGIVSADEIEKRELTSFRDAFRTLGNVLDADWNDAGFIIRGVNSEGLVPGGSPLAAIYVDGVQQTVNGARRGARGLWDVEQVEVYRGPQSTLSGRAALAGAIYIKTKDPTHNWEAAGRITLGTDQLRAGSAMVSGPVIEDQVAFRATIDYSIKDNDLNYPTYSGFDRYDDYITDEYYQARAKLLITPDGLPDTELLVSYSYSFDSPYVRDIGGPVLGFDYADRRGDLNIPAYAEDRSADTHNVSAELTHELTGAITLTSLTGFSANDTDRSSINEGTAGETELTDGAFQQKLFTQELRINVVTGPMRAVLGGYLADDQNRAGYTRNAYGRMDVSRSKGDVLNLAAFGEIVYEVFDNIDLIAGGRGDYTKQKNTQFFSRNGTVSTDTALETAEFVFLPKAGISIALAGDQTVGFTAQRGFRSGGIGVQSSTGRERRYDPEFTWTYELGYKASFDTGRVSLSANVFYSTWQNQQIEVLEDPTDFTSGYTTNAAESKSWGFEVETRLKPYDQIDAFLSLGYVDTEFEDFTDLNFGDLSGYPFPEAPKWNLAFGLFYNCDCGVFVGADAKYVSEFLARLSSTGQTMLDGYLIANMQAGYDAGPWKLTLFAENVFDKDYFTYEQLYDPGTGVREAVAATVGEGRLIGLTLSLFF